MRELNKQKFAFIIGAAALVLIVLLALAISSGRGLNSDNHIVLPPDSAQAVPERSSSTQDFAELDTQNVRSILEDLQRPEAYHQKMSVTVEAGSRTRTQTVELWRRGEYFAADIADDDTVRHLLGSSRTVYIWYDSEEAYSAVSLREGMTLDALVGIADYKSVLSLPTDSIIEANYVELGEQDGLACIFVSSMQNGLLQYYWVSVESGLLCKQTTLSDEKPVYSAQQLLLEPLDEDFAFLLPDGSDPFTEE